MYNVYIGHYNYVQYFIYQTQDTLGLQATFSILAMLLLAS